MSHGQHFTTTDVLRLEVEVEPTGLVNLIANPDGKSGAWGWITPVAGSNMSTDYMGLKYTSPNPAAASYFYSEPMPIAAGQYAAAAWTQVSISGYVRARFEWLNSALAVIGSSTQTGYLNTNGAQALSAQLAPASTAFMRLRFDHYSTTGGANPAAGATFVFKDVKVAKAATSGALGSTRKNLVTNPSFETDATGWSPINASHARSTAQFRTGTASLAITSNGTDTVAWSYTTISVVTPGHDYRMSFYARAGTTPRQMIGAIQWLDANGRPIMGGPHASGDNTTTTDWTRLSVLGTAPTNAASARVYAGVKGTTAAGEVTYVDSVMVTEGTDEPDYFDGATAASGTKTYSWDGTAHQSASNLIDSTLGSLVPTNWRNILGPSHDIKVDREALNLGTLSATILDATMDPSQTTNLRPGRRVRLLALAASPDWDGDSVWEPVFTGKVTQIDVEYEEKDTSKPPRITLTAVDATQALAAARRPQGVATIGELPYVLEGAGVPWKINGSGNQVPTATVVSENDNATALDQIAITRDSELGYAWVDRKGVLNAWNYAPNGLIINGTFEFDAKEWTGSGGSATIARTTAQKRSGSASLAVTRTGTTGTASAAVNNIQNLPVTPGVSYTFTAYVRSASVARSARVEMIWYDFDGGWLSSVFGASVTTTTTGWTKVEFTGVAPADAAMAQPKVNFVSAAAGETHYVDDASMTVTTLNESVYTDLQMSFSSTDCINSVTVKRLSWDPADTTKTIETAYGPYEDSASITSWGRRSAEFTVHGISEANVPAYAQSILTRNANPAVRVESLTVPIMETTDIAASKALLDLYDLVNVENADKGIDQDLRVTGVSHRITPEKWMVELTFAHTNSVASPQETPPVQGLSALPNTGWLDLPLASGWGEIGAPWSKAQYRRIDGEVMMRGIARNLTGGTVAAGGLIGTLPVDFRPTHNQGFTTYWHNGTAEVAGKVNIYGTNTTYAGNVEVPGAVPNTMYVFLDTIRFRLD